MKNQETSTSQQNNFRSERGRDTVPVEAALDAQIKLARYMAGDTLWDSLSADEQDILMMEWLVKYASNETNGTGFNGFTEYCNIHAEDYFMERVVSKTLTDEDLVNMQRFFEENPKGGKFIAKH